MIFGPISIIMIHFGLTIVRVISTYLPAIHAKLWPRIPWLCYERSFSEFYLSIWNQLVFNQMLQLFVQSPQPYLLIFAWRNKMCFPNILVKKIKKNKWLSEFHKTNHKEFKCWSSFYVNYFLRYYLMMQLQPIVKRVYGANEWACSPNQLLILYKHKRQDETQSPQSSWPVPICT